MPPSSPRESPPPGRESSLRWVADGVDALAAAHDADTVLATLAQYAVAHLADFCVVFTKRASDGFELAFSRHRDRANDAVAQKFAHHYSASQVAGAGVALVMRTGQSELLPIVANADPVPPVGSGGQHPRDLLRAFAMHSAMTVPLKAGVATIGAIVLTRSESKSPFDADDLAVAETLARIGAWSITHPRRTQQPHATSGSEQMLSVASHEVMNCLGVIGMSAAILLRTGEHDPTTRAKHLNVIDRDTKHVARLSRDLIDIAKLHTETLALNREPQNAAALVRDAIESVGSEARAGAIVVADTNTEVDVHGDRERLLHVLSTLLNYATGHASAPYSITVSAVAAADQIRITVSDKDSGLSDAMFSLLSDPLHCIGRTDTRELGLQLYICQGVIAAHGGRLWVERLAEARGYRFCLTLPLVT